MFRDQDFHITYFDASRIMFNKATVKENKYYVKYMNEATSNNVAKSMYIDVHGTSKNAISFCQKQYGVLPAVFLLTIGAKTYKDMPKECYEHYKRGLLMGCAFDKAGSPIEMLNYSLTGSLSNYTKNGPDRLPPEYNLKILKPYHKCVETFLKLHDQTSGYFISAQKMENVEACIKYISRRISKRKN